MAGRAERHAIPVPGGQPRKRRPARAVPSVSAPGTGRPRIARVFALVATLLAFFAAQLQVEQHEAAHFHVVCADHGGVIEDVPLATADADPHDDGAVMRSASSEADSVHQGCDLPPALTAGAIEAAAPCGLPLIDVGPLLSQGAPEGVPGRTGPPLLALAPKLSPPRV